MGCMGESVVFWLENRNCAGIRAAAIGDHLLVLYRERYYVVTDGSAQSRGGKPLRYATSSLPTPWKRALKGDLPSAVALPSDIDPIPAQKPRKPVRKKREKPAMPEPEQETTAAQSENAALLPAKKTRKVEAKPVAQAPVVANCPYCNARHEIPVEKGKNGKPFFMPCSRCKSEFAVRFVQVTVFQAQVAGFR